MRWVSAILLAAMAAVVVLAGTAGPGAAPPVRAGTPSVTAPGGLRLGVGVNVHIDRISLDGFVVCDDGTAAPGTRVRRVELLATPSAGEYLDRLAAGARVAGALSRIGLHHWWRHVSAPFTVTKH
jgi:hypothetical protein